VQYFDERLPFGGEPPCERSATYAELSCDLPDLGLPVRQQRHDRVFNPKAPKARTEASRRQGFVEISHQKRDEIWIGAGNLQIGDLVWKCHFVCRTTERNIDAEEGTNFGWNAPTAMHEGHGHRR